MKYNLNNLIKVFSFLYALTSSTSVFSADDNSITTVIDKGESGTCYAKLSPETDVAINKDDAEVFSIYMDMGKAFFNVLRIRGGQNVIKAGDHVIIKTFEPKTIVFGTSEKQSSVSYDDIICPTEDTPVEDFCTNHPLSEGEYIYMLTNMEKNGGFGFTYFTGKTMKKGNFYIVSTQEPETTGIQTVKPSAVSVDGAIYNLQGIRVSNPVEGQIYIQNGRKFVKRSNAISMPSQEQPTTVIPVVTRADKDIEDGDPVPFLPGEAGDEDGF